MYEAAELGFSLMIMVGLGSLIIVKLENEFVTLIGLTIWGLLVGTGLSKIIGMLKFTFF